MKRNLFNIRFDETIKKRRNRRRMAWVSLLSMIAIVLLMMFFVSVDRIKELVTVIDTLFFCLASIVLGYLGVAVYDDLNIMKHNSSKTKNDESDEEEEAINSGKKK